MLSTGRRLLTRRLPAWNNIHATSIARGVVRDHTAAFSTTRGPHATATPSDTAKAPSPVDQFANGNNAYYAEEMFRCWRQDPSSVHPSWATYFSGLDSGLRSEDAFRPPPGLVSLPSTDGNAPFSLAGGNGSGLVEDHMKVQLLVRAFQVRGHHIANLDPLGINQPDLSSTMPPELTIENYGWTEKDLDMEFELGAGILPRFKEQGVEKMSLRKIIDACKQIYSGSIGIQYIHIPNRDECDWIRERIEIPEPWKYTVDEKRMILDRLIWSDSFERFIASKYPNEKRFGLEGAESMIPGMKALIDRSVELGVQSIVIGMPHRGRLNVLANVIRKPTEAILAEFAPSLDPTQEAAADVKYHLGANYVRPTPSGKKVSLSLVANPSHLEAEDGVVLGKTKGIQHFEGQGDLSSAMGLLLHGDAAFAGQGIVYETMGFHDLPYYGTGGTIHLIVNNQIGFTTNPAQGRSTPYPSDIAKSIDAPIFHVNGDDPEAVTFVCQLAADFRAKFKKDVVIDLICYRRHGHNEGDQPMFTQPKMYQVIKDKPTTLDVYTQALVEESTFTNEETEKHKSWVWGMLENSFEASKEYKPTSKEWLSSSWDGFPSPRELKENVLEARPTGVEFDVLRKVGKIISTYPKDFEVHRNLARILKTRGTSVEDGKGIDYSTAEALAFGTLALEKTHVRVSGQDVERGTFSQRHAVLHEQNTDALYMPLAHLSEDQATVTVCNSSLSEFGVLGFELGYSLVDPALLVIWEAQFGDFSNGAQIMIDQFIASGEKKWLQRSGLVMSLPHGYDGQGPEHSSARIERFLQLCDDHPFHYPTSEKQARQHQDCNMQLVYPTIPSNIFHALRRQIHRDYRKPLIVFFSKNLLRHPQARSSLEEIGPDTHFQRYIPEPEPEGFGTAEDVQRHILCSGQVYYALLAEREKRGLQAIVAISRVEQLSPLPYDLITPHLDRYPNAVQYWVQEEPINGGAWQYMQPRLETAMRETAHHASKRIYVAGREPVSSVATGSKKQHFYEIEQFMEQAFDLSKHAQSHGSQKAH
ncbi:BZ3500_MvSof-1268-A1-R1_Chr10-2g02825 [Microbotryum saponariae]|uniref:2-oxoglutarate dehydrogenase, mitochondrial n=1 Tax=Microbotryum saponariae TaxID=289078 RepID=A0A2X0LYC0_9BASI|nr:BZ3501_MvSof-1269-A2-R1_Chr10-2g02416 [Microbotryum saponariae]SDA01595.1 BZ3500_MvSof-1268-A1-R1_Chr10-2g02825 [Microbotryum saponariae]